MAPYFRRRLLLFSVAAATLPLAIGGGITPALAQSAQAQPALAQSAQAQSAQAPTQALGSPSQTLPSSLNYDSIYTSPGSITLDRNGWSTSTWVQAGGSWSARANDSWISISPSSGYEGGSLMYVSAGANPGAQSRSGTVTLTSGYASATLYVNQDPALPTVTLSQTSWNPSSYQSSTYLRVDTNSTGTWSAESSASWLSVSPSSGWNGSSATVYATENTTSQDRTATLRFSVNTLAGTGSATLSVRQYAGLPSLSLSMTNWNPTGVAQTTEIGVTTNMSSWSASSTDRWITVSPWTGWPGDKLRVSIDANPSEFSRMGYVDVRAGSAWQTLTVWQWGSIPSVVLSSTRWDPSFTAQDMTLRVTTNMENWYAHSNNSWISVSPGSGWGSFDTTTIYVQANTSATARAGSVTVTAGSASATLTVLQAGQPPACSAFSVACTWTVTSPITVTPVGTAMHYLKFTVPTTGSWTLFSSDRASTSDPYAVLYNSSQAQMATSDDDGGDRHFKITATLTAGQTYYLGLRQYSTSYSGQFKVNATAPVPACTTFAVACAWTVTSPITVSPTGATLHYLKFTVPTSGSWTLFSSERTTNADPYAVLYDSAQKQLALSDDDGGDRHFKITASLVTGQTYYLAVRHYSTAYSGQFKVSATAPCLTFSSACVWTSTAPITIGPVGTSLHYLRFTVPVTGSWTLKSSDRASTADPYAVLYNSSQSQLATSDDNGGDLNFMITATLTAGQTYYLGVRQYSSSQSGVFTVSALPPCSSFATSCSWTATSTLTVTPVGSNLHYLRFVAPTTGLWTLESTDRASNADPYAVLYSSSQAQLDYSDDDAGNLNFRIVASLTAGQTYYLGVRHFSSSHSGSFKVSGRLCSSTSSACLWTPTTPQTVSPVGTTMQYLRFTVATSGWWTIQSSERASTADPYAQLLLGFPMVLAMATSDDEGGDRNFRFHVQLAAGQTYFLGLRHYSTSYSGQYKVTASMCQSFSSACDWLVTTPITVSPVGTTLQYQRFTVPTTGTWRIQSSDRASSSDPYAVLYNSSQSQIAYSDDDAGDRNFRITASLTAGQIYYLAVRQYSTSYSGQFKITATRQ
ncbi:MAG: BACON domain-containing protein [Micrococcales bacterium]|nr:BACON domain-containing protein [Micrococcales bacterium]